MCCCAGATSDFCVNICQEAAASSSASVDPKQTSTWVFSVGKRYDKSILGFDHVRFASSIWDSCQVPWIEGWQCMMKKHPQANSVAGTRSNRHSSRPSRSERISMSHRGRGLNRCKLKNYHLWQFYQLILDTSENWSGVSGKVSWVSGNAPEQWKNTLPTEPVPSILPTRCHRVSKVVRPSNPCLCQLVCFLMQTWCVAQRGVLSWFSNYLHFANTNTWVDRPK